MTASCAKERYDEQVSRLVVMLLLVACGDGPGQQTIRGEPTLETFERRMCACRDAPCAQQVIEDITRWSQRIKTPRADRGNTAEIMARYNACMTEVLRTR